MACISLPTALAVSGGLSAAGGVANAVIGAGAAKQAARTEAAAADRAIANQQGQWKESEALVNPFISAGTGAIPVVQGLLGLPGAGGAPDSAAVQRSLEATPGYQFALKQGLQQAQSGFASAGLAESGPAIKGAINYATGVANTTYEQRLQDYMGLLGQGQSAATTLSGQGLLSAGQINQLLLGQGQARAAGTVGAANAITGGISNALGGISNSALALGLNSAGMFGMPQEGASVLTPASGTIPGATGLPLGYTGVGTPNLLMRGA